MLPAETAPRLQPLGREKRFTAALQQQLTAAALPTSDMTHTPLLLLRSATAAIAAAALSAWLRAAR